MLRVNSSSFQGLELWVIFFIVLFKTESKILFLVKEKILEEGRIYKRTKRKRGRERQDKKAGKEGKRRKRTRPGHKINDKNRDHYFL